MYEQQLVNEAGQLAAAIEQQGNIGNASQLLIADTQGMSTNDAHFLIDKTNAFAQAASGNQWQQHRPLRPY
jgi:hypothetical protein